MSNTTCTTVTDFDHGQTVMADCPNRCKMIDGVRDPWTGLTVKTCKDCGADWTAPFAN